MFQKNFCNFQRFSKSRKKNISKDIEVKITVRKWKLQAPTANVGFA
jgi:hypothetical protein